MPTIYDILPTLEKELIKLLHDFMAADNGALYTWEITIFLPAANAYIHYLDGVNISLEHGNYISTMANLRGLIESLAAVVYDGTQKLPEAAYKRFMKTGRLPEWDHEKRKWADLGPTESVKYAQLVVSPEIKLKEIYAACCDMLHFSSAHMSFLGGFSPRVDTHGRIVQIKIGAKDNIPPKEQREIIDLCVELTTQLGKCVRAAIQEKSQRDSKRTV